NSPEMLNATVLIRMLLYKIYKIHFQYILYKYNNLGTLADNHINLNTDEQKNSNHSYSPPF
ncbi:MAG: hypothetical protein RBT74_00940, partial [Tenuifilaceae bacterium]|nr:hypothetical protein [Tenuifilaceae bacterium]